MSCERGAFACFEFSILVWALWLCHLSSRCFASCCADRLVRREWESKVHGKTSSKQHRVTAKPILGQPMSRRRQNGNTLDLRQIQLAWGCGLARVAKVFGRMDSRQSRFTAGCTANLIRGKTDSRQNQFRATPSHGKILCFYKLFCLEALDPRRTY